MRLAQRGAAVNPQHTVTARSRRLQLEPRPRPAEGQVVTVLQLPAGCVNGYWE
jgi:hypothetical protein